MNKENSSNQPSSSEKVLLIVMDGWGLAPKSQGNAPSQASTPNLDEISKYYPAAALHAAGISVGLPWWEEGNSEVGHLTMGCGQVIYQYLPRILMSIQEGSFFENEAFLKATDHVKENDSKLHLMGLVSSGAVHSYIDHLYALLKLAKQQKVDKVYLHLFTDGRDTPPKEGGTFLQNLKQRLSLQGTGEIATICGRGYAMDRNENWDKIEEVYNCLTKGEAPKVNDPIQYLKSSYEEGTTDEYIKPAVVNKEGLIEKNDSIIFFNFREDRAKELTAAFVKEDFDKFPRKKIENLCFSSMTQYSKDLDTNVAYDPKEIKSPLGKILENANLPQLRVAEAEKSAHVTYFFNGLEEEPFEKEERKIFASKGGPHYETNPEMRTPDITKKVVEEINNEKYPFILANLANPDMIGHTTEIKSAIKAAEVVDDAVGKMVSAAKGKYKVIITADHGNFEEMLDSQTAKKIGEHTSNFVPFYLVDEELKSKNPGDKRLRQKTKAGGFLFDIAPTVLDYLKIEKPEEMIGSSLKITLG